MFMRSVGGLKSGSCITGVRGSNRSGPPFYVGPTRDELWVAVKELK